MGDQFKLDERDLKRVTAPDKGYTYLWDTGPNRVAGFGARITAKGVRAFILDYRMDGRKRRITIGRHPAWSVKAARQRAAELKFEADKGHDPLDEREARRAKAQDTLRKYLDTHYNEHQRHKKSGDQTIAMLRNSFAKIGSKPLHQISKADILAWRRQREADGLKFQTIKRHFDALRALLNHAVANDHLSSNPLDGFQLQAPAATAQEQLDRVTARKMLEPDEVEAFFAGLDAFNVEKRDQRRRSRAAGKTHLPDLDGLRFAHPAVPWFRLAYFTGFRPGDLFGLQWEHCDLKAGHIRKVIEKTAQHQPDPQTFPLSPAAASTLRDWWEQNGKLRSGHVFASERTGGRMDKHAMQRPWAHVKKLGGLPDSIDIYTLRHNFASQLIRAGQDLYTVSKLMAHTSIETTINNYAHLAPDHASEAVAKLPGALDAR